MLHRRTQFFISLFVLFGIALEVSAGVRNVNWNPQAWIETIKDDADDSGEVDADLCHGYVGSQEQICHMILNLTRASRSSLGPKLQEAIDNEHVWCATTIEAHKTVLSAELLVLDEALRLTRQLVLLLTNRETELEQEAAEAKEKSDALQKKLDEMKRNQQQGDANNLAEQRRLEEELAAAKREINKLNDKKDKLKLEKDRVTFHFKRVTKENEALSSQVRELKKVTDQHSNDQGMCDAQQTRISTLEQDLQQLKNELLDTQTGCNVKVEKLEQKAEARLQEIQDLKKKIEEGNAVVDAENQATIRRLQQREQEYKTKIADLESRDKDLQRELAEVKKIRDQCKIEGEKLKSEKKIVETNLQICTTTNNEMEEEKKKSAAALKTKTDELQACIIKSITTTTTTIRTTQKPAPGTVKLATGTYLFQGMVGGKYLSWEAARQHCRTLGMDLVAIESQEENAALAAYARSLPLFRSWMAWTSGCYSKEQKNFVWQSTNSPFVYKNFINPRTIETMNSPSCIGFMSVLAKWSTINPTQQIQPFICELSK